MRNSLSLFLILFVVLFQLPVVLEAQEASFAPLPSHTPRKIVPSNFTAQKAIDELDLPQTNIDVAITESFNWLKANNYC